MATKSDQYYYGVGRRKEATATVRLKSGRGVIMVNGKLANEYFGSDLLTERLMKPLAELGKEKAYDASIKVHGGGKSGQADAATLAIAKSLTAQNEELRATLRKAGFLARDTRIKERKKYGLKRARKAPQFTKR